MIKKDIKIVNNKIKGINIFLLSQTNNDKTDQSFQKLAID